MSLYLGIKLQRRRSGDRGGEYEYDHLMTAARNHICTAAGTQIALIGTRHRKYEYDHLMTTARNFICTTEGTQIALIGTRRRKPAENN